ncbi:MAG: SprT-like domain-containing protein [Deltaproteobacteria bacterium]|nr:SprT-like domain-containing protein [Deltaproteobacteria bacterium]
MFDYFNRELFANALPAVILNFSRHSRMRGFFAPERWRGGAGAAHEISLNPDHLSRAPREWASTLVHEMAHLWQRECGSPSRSGYHNKEWGAKMDELGLTPSDTAEPGGRRTGQRMSHYIVDGGPFDVAFARMPREILLPWASGSAAAAPGPTTKNKLKLKYSCPVCRTNVWGKPGLQLVCLADGEVFVTACEAEAGEP